MRWKHGLVTALALGLAVAASNGAAAQEVDVDLELVLAVDISRSMDRGERELQKQGYIAALQHPEVLAAIRAGFLGKIAVTFMEWAGPGAQNVVVPWTMIDGEASAAMMAATIEAGPPVSLRGTSISGALTASAALFPGNGFRSTRQVIDVSGDGPNNMGRPVLDARDEVLAQGITINGLPIVLGQGYPGPFSIDQLDVYYEDCVIGGPGAFLITVESMDRFAEAVRRKLVLEIAGQKARIVPAQLQPERERRISCLIGETLRRRWMDP